jgi:hypothetical protein
VLDEPAVAPAGALVGVFLDEKIELLGLGAGVTE